MKRLLTLAVAAIIVATQLLGGAGPASAAGPAKKKCTTGLASGISWDHSDPQYMKIVPAVSWQNCRGAIRKVRMETRWIDANGGLARTDTQTYTADVVHQANGTQAYSHPMYIGMPYGSFNFDNGNSFKDCAHYASSGRDTTDLTGSTWYVVAQAYDRGGRKILEKISPAIVCDQNG